MRRTDENRLAVGWARSLAPAAVCTCLALIVCLPAAAVEVGVPLEGYYRPGKYMPLRIAAPPGAAGELSIEAAGAITTAVALEDGAAGVVVPFLPVDALRQVRWRLGAGAWTVLTANWRPLGPDDRLVGFATVDMDLARELFPGAEVIPIRLDPARPLPESLTAWETLDLLVLDNPSLVDDAMLGQLLGGQVSVAVRSDIPPDVRWPWRRVGHYWVVSHEVAGPKRAAEYPPALAAVQGWRADWPAAFRWRIVLYAVGFGVLAMGVALLRWRWTSAVMVALSAVTLGALGLWWSGRSPVVQRGGQVLVAGERLAQLDTWIYRSTARSAADRVAFSTLMRPFFEIPEQNAYMRMTLRCDGDGWPVAFEYRLPTSLKAAFVSRELAPRRGQMDPEAADGSPLVRLAQRVYMRPHHRLWGLVRTAAPAQWDASSAQWWGTLVVEDVPRGQVSGGATP